jgi:alkylation response protein AidB-like acyl-CoA dehydrogenase
VRFHLSEEQVAMVASVRGTLSTLTSRESLLRFADGNEDLDPEVWNALMGLGLGALVLPEREGGSGLGLLDLALLVEAAGAVATPGPLLQHLVATLAVGLCDDAALKARLLGRLAEGTTIATLAFGDGWPGSQFPASFEHGRATGSVAPVTGAISASVFVVNTQDGGLALVEDEGVGKRALAGTDRSRPVGQVKFDNAAATLIFAPGDARIMRVFNAALILIAADALGGAQYCLDLSVAYAGEREQFGQPIGRFQALKHQLAAMAMEVEPARALLWYAAHAWDAGLDDASHAAAQAKAHITDRFVSVSRAAVEAHGAIGYTWEYGLHLWLRRALFDQAYLGSPAVHRARAAQMAGW